MMPRKILLLLLVFFALGVFVSTGCLDRITGSVSAFEVDIKWKLVIDYNLGIVDYNTHAIQDINASDFNASDSNSSQGYFLAISGDANGYIVPVGTRMVIADEGTFEVHCVDGDTDSWNPPLKVVVYNLDRNIDQNHNLPDFNLTKWLTSGVNTSFLEQTRGSNHFCGSVSCSFDRQCDQINGGKSLRYLKPPVDAYDFNVDGYFRVRIFYNPYFISHTMMPDCNNIDANGNISDANCRYWKLAKDFNVTVFAPLMVIYGYKNALLPLTPGQTTETNIIWTFHNLSKIDMKIQDINVPICRENNLTCTWLADPKGITVPTNGFVVFTQNIKLENPPASYAARDLNLTLDVLYSDVYGVLNFKKVSEPTLLKIKPLNQQKFSVKVDAGESNICYGLEEGNVKTGYTGEYAVPRVKLSWEWSSISRNDCDRSANPTSPYHYCDSSQFLMELLKKLERIDQINTNDLSAEPSPNPALELYKLQNFEAYLIKDGYTADLINDLRNYLLTEPLLATSSWYKPEDGDFFRIFTNPYRFKILLANNRSNLENSIQLNSPNSTTLGIPSPGVYEVFIRVQDNYDDNSLRKFMLNGQINTDINIYLVKLSDPQPNSIFYYMPIDGKIGFVQDSTGGRYDRQGYGSAYSGPADKNLIIIATGNPPTVGGSAQNLVRTTDLPDDFSRINHSERGGVLRISQAEDVNSFSISRYLSTATPVLMRIKQGRVSNDAGVPTREAGDFYEIKKNESVGNPGEAIAGDPTKNNMSYWNALSSNMMAGTVCIDFESKRLSSSFYNKPDSVFTNYSEEVRTQCNPSSNMDPAKMYGFSWNNLALESDQNFIYLQTVFYSSKGSNYKLKPACDKKPTLLYSLPQQTAFKGGEILLNYNPKLSDQTNIDIESLKGIFEAVKAGYVCVNSDPTIADFWWNEKKLFEDLKTIPQLPEELTTTAELCKSQAPQAGS